MGLQALSPEGRVQGGRLHCGWHTEYRETSDQGAQTCRRVREEEATCSLEGKAGKDTPKKHCGKEEYKPLPTLSNSDEEPPFKRLKAMSAFERH
jgi:hypothetical protein